MKELRKASSENNFNQKKNHFCCGEEDKEMEPKIIFT